MRTLLLLLLPLYIGGDRVDDLHKAIEELNDVAAGEAAAAIALENNQKSLNVLLRAVDQCSRISSFENAAFEKARSGMRALQTDPNKKIGQKEVQYNRLLIQYHIHALRKDKAERVRSAILTAFKNLNRDTLVKAVARKLRGKGEEESRAALAEAMGFINHEDTAKNLLEILKKEKSALVKISGIDALARRAVRDAESLKLVASFLTDDDWRVIVSAASMIKATKSLDAVAPLIEALQSAQGRARWTINDVLVSLTGINRHGSHDAWKDWWGRNGKGVRAGTYDPPRGEIGNVKSGSTFYGIPVTSRKVVFALDASASMGSPAKWKPPVASGEPRPLSDVKLKGDKKIDVARYELKRAIAMLPEGTLFNVVFFHHKTWSFRPDMVKLNKTTMRQAWRFIDDVKLVLATDIYGALRESFRFRTEVDTVYLLSDGAPYLRPAFAKVGVSQTTDILEAVRTWNRHGKVTVHTIGIESIMGGHVFLGQLAAQTGGTYVRRPPLNRNN